MELTEYFQQRNRDISIPTRLTHIYGVLILDICSRFLKETSFSCVKLNDCMISLSDSGDFKYMIGLSANYQYYFQDSCYAVKCTHFYKHENLFS